MAGTQWRLALLALLVLSARALASTSSFGFHDCPWTGDPDAVPADSTYAVAQS